MSDKTLEQYLKEHPNIQLVHFKADDSDYSGWVDNAVIEYTVNKCHPNGWWSVTTYPATSGRYQGTDFNEALKALEEKTFRKWGT